MNYGWVVSYLLEISNSSDNKIIDFSVSEGKMFLSESIYKLISATLLDSYIKFW